MVFGNYISILKDEYKIHNHFNVKTTKYLIEKGSILDGVPIYEPLLYSIEESI